jgi:hypothetical protein
MLMTGQFDAAHYTFVYWSGHCVGRIWGFAFPFWSMDSLSDIVQWAATVVLLIGVALSSFNIYPAYLIPALFGNFLWLIAGIYLGSWPLIITQTVITLLYIGGCIKYLINKKNANTHTP